MRIRFLSPLLLAAGIAYPMPPAPAQPVDGPLVGVIQPYRVVHVGAAAEGLLEEVRVDRGDIVHSGQVLATLAFETERANAAMAKARSELVAPREIAKTKLELSRDRLQRREGLVAQGIVTADELQILRTEVRLAELALMQADEVLNVARLEYRRASAVLERGTVRSPLDGVVVDRLLSPGELLSKSGSTEVVVLAQLNPLLVELFVPLEQHGAIKIGDEALIEPYGGQFGTRSANVVVVDRIIDTASGTFRMRLELDNSDLTLPAGLRCDVTFPR